MKRSYCWYRTSLAGFILALLVAVSVDAATITVSSTLDAGGTCPGASCTLRQAIATAASGDTINFAAGITTIDLTSGELLINKNLTISGPGANLLTVQRSTAGATPAFRIFEINPNSVIATISGLTIANGNIPGNGLGGGILNLGTLTLTSSTISGNLAGGGGGISNTNSGSTLTLTNSTVSGNSAVSGIVSGGGIVNGGTMTIVNSTISGNTSSGGGSGGGILNFATLTLTNSTISGNSVAGADGGGIADSGVGTVKARNTIVAKNTATTGPDVSGELTSQGYNLIGNSSGATITGTANNGDQLNVDPKLGPLQDNGGPTKTHALLSGSRAIEAGDSSGSNTDQRGFARPVVSPLSSKPGDGGDIGAYEVQADQLLGCNTINRIVNNTNDSGTDSLRAVIANVCIGSTITFAANVRGAITLTSGELLLNKSVTISGPGARALTISGNNASRIFNVPGGVTAAVSGLTIANGNTVGGGSGAAVFNSGTLTLTNCTVQENSGGSGGGVANSGTLTVSNCTFARNQSSGNGGALRNNGVMSVSNSTLHDNTAVASGAIASFNNGPAPTLTVTNCTISGNRGNDPNASGGGILNGGTATVRNTIVANNTAANGPDLFGSFTSDGFNLIGVNSGATITPAQFSDQIGTPGSPINPLLGSLQDNGGPTDTLALLSGSPAIDRGHSSGSTTDQRGSPRPVDFPAITNVTGGDGGDIGAFEVQVGLVGNVSTRLPVGTNDNVLIEGFIVQGPAGSTKKILVRAIGPSLAPFGIRDALANPALEIRDENSATIATNDNWRNTQIGGIITADQSGEIATSGAPPSDDLESAIIADLAPGSYTAVVAGAGGTVGTGVVDAYDLSAASPARLANVATRGLIQPGDKLMIAGFIVQNAPVQAVVRAIGPSLSAFGITNALPDTTLQVKNENGNTVIENDDWQTNQKAELEQTTLQPSNPLEAAVVVTLPPGQYTAQVRGKPETTGIGVVQVYFLQ